MKINKQIVRIGLVALLALPAAFGTALANEQGHDGRHVEHRRTMEREYGGVRSREHSNFMVHDGEEREHDHMGIARGPGYYHHDGNFYDGHRGYWYAYGDDWCFRADDGFVYCQQPGIGTWGWFRF